MRLSVGLLLGTAVLVGGAAAFNISNNNKINNNNKVDTTSSSRRDFLTKSASTAAILSSVGLPKIAIADDGDDAPAAANDEYADYITTDSGMKYLVTKEGDGAVPTSGQTVKAHYTGWLDGFESSKKFDSSRDRGRPFTFKVGAGQVIR